MIKRDKTRGRRDAVQYAAAHDAGATPNVCITTKTNGAANPNSLDFLQRLSALRQKDSGSLSSASILVDAWRKWPLRVGAGKRTRQSSEDLERETKAPTKKPPFESVKRKRQA